MTAAIAIQAGTAPDLRCHHCSRWIGESDRPVELVGLFKRARDRQAVPLPRLSYQCPGCGWVNVFRPMTDRGGMT